MIRTILWAIGLFLLVGYVTEGFTDVQSQILAGGLVGSALYAGLATLLDWMNGVDSHWTVDSVPDRRHPDDISVVERSMNFIIPSAALLMGIWLLGASTEGFTNFGPQFFVGGFCGMVVFSRIGAAYRSLGM